MWCIHTTECCLATKNVIYDEVIHVITWVSLENMLNEVSETLHDSIYMKSPN